LNQTIYVTRRIDENEIDRVLLAGNIRSYIIQRAHFVHIKAPVNGFHLKHEHVHSQVSL